MTSIFLFEIYSECIFSSGSLSISYAINIGNLITISIRFMLCQCEGFPLVVVMVWAMGWDDFKWCWHESNANVKIDNWFEICVSWVLRWRTKCVYCTRRLFFTFRLPSGYSLSMSLYMCIVMMRLASSTFSYITLKRWRVLANIRNENYKRKH